MHLIKFFLYLIIIICLLLMEAETKRILGIFPHFGYSHFKVFYPLLRNLAEKGHNLTVITYIKAPSLPNDNYNELILKGMNVMNMASVNDMKARTLKGLFEEYIELHDKGQKSCKFLYESGYVEEVLKRHKQQPYDLVITEYFNTDCHLALPYLMKKPVVALSSCLLMPWHYDRIIMPDTPSFIQSELIGFRTPLSLQERLMNFLQAKILPLIYRYHTNYMDNKLVHHYLNIDIDVDQIAKQYTRLILGNQHYSLMDLRPFTQQFVEIGGIHINEEEIRNAIPSEVDLFLKNTTKDVLFISWGSMIKGSTLDQNKLQIILNVLTKQDIKVIWKWESDKVPIESDQFLFVKWAPQLTLLCHPKIKLFWGHGGLLSTTEAVYCGKPMLITPIYGDQYVNGFAVENRKIGRIIQINEIAEKTLKDKLTQLQHSNYSSKALQISQVFRDRQVKPLDTATWWVEHILDHKITEEVLNTYAVDLNWFVYYSLDVISILLVILIVFLLIIKFLIRFILRTCSYRKFHKLKEN
ncbi:UDP-glycosyltransferase UGT5-like [Lucilia sericata]|uniref:UDP-glycosyltransferase UGT5-like n=1 Tax=Lucilia sericata TaxID=13632 RepID=UPI0018A8003E|nr:UDP-glycosyltransferase UGT5-like [Lucilia sericata]